MMNINDLLIEVKAKQSRSENDKALFLRELFLIWYALVEDVECENFTEGELQRMLTQCVGQFKTSYYDDADCLFLVGWAVEIAFWYFEASFTEEDGQKMLNAAYKCQPRNKLFKWANRNELALSNKEVDGLAIELQKNFYSYYNYGPYIKEYFLDLITSPLS